MNKPPRILLISPVEYPSATIYITKPLLELARQRKCVFHKALEAQVTLAQIRSSDLVIFCRNCEPEYSWMIEECLAQHIPTIYELDDNFWEVPLDLPYAGYYRAPHRLAQLEYYLENVDLVRVYSAPLAGRVTQYNTNVLQVPPCIDLRLAPQITQMAQMTPGVQTTAGGQRSPEHPIRITYATGRGGSDELISLFGDDLLQLMQNYPERIEMHWWGEIPEKFRGLPGMFLIDIIHDYDQYIRFLATRGFAIGLAPLIPNTFNLSKTNTKFRDYGACRVAGIYSDVSVYVADIEHECTGLLVDDRPGSWYAAMARLVEDSNLRRSICEAAYKFVSENYRQELTEQLWLETLDTLVRPLEEWTVGSGQWAERKTQISLGCRVTPPVGWIGVDRHPYPGVQVIADLDQPLPFANDSAHLLLADQVLETVQQPESLLSEAYRISRHGAQVCVFTDYASPGLQALRAVEASKEHRAGKEQRFTTGTAAGAVTSHDSILYSQRLPLDGVNLFCLSTEYFYTHPYLNMREEQRRKLRQKRPAICDRAFYRFIALKQAKVGQDGGSMSIEKGAGGKEHRAGGKEHRAGGKEHRAGGKEHRSLEYHLPMLEAAQWFEPDSVSRRRAEDHIDYLHVELDSITQRNKVEIQQLRDELAAAQAETEQVRASLLGNLQAERERARQVLAARDFELEQSRASHAALQTEFEQTRANLQARSEEIERAMEKQRARAVIAVNELEVHRNRKLVRMLQRMFDRSDAAKDLSPNFIALRDDSLIFFPQNNGYCLQPSVNLMQIPYLGYTVEFNQPGLCEIALAMIMDMQPRDGVLGIELVSPASQIVAQVVTPASQVDETKPLIFQFAPLSETAQGRFELRLFARNVDLPVRVYEWHRYLPLGLGGERRLPFCAFGFQA